MKTFTASLSRGVTLITGLVVVILLTVSTTLAFTLPDPGTPKSILIISLPPISILVGLLFKVSGYTVSGSTIRVQRRLRPREIPIGSVVSIEVSPELIKSSLRTFGNGGLFGFYGRFWKPEMGSFVAFVTNPANTVLVRTHDRIYALSPDQPEAFMDAVNDSLNPAATGQDATES